MPLRNKIKDLVDGRGITPYRFWKDTGLSRNTAYNLYNDPTYIPGAEIITAICEVYKCQPGDFLMWLEDERN
ncbi:helix-turn-helix transcriptional regulator [Leptolyngbya sp. FACHB-261]|uniref:helix-turn-helix domain-containing protein n=1 Tax=Leptolyngbya sp. FACHB-261 TaxID=2692806 RepID=UPI001684148E|nr:helix-turn-helix transcriptional regulator [Leptolyngbya sp. FACHB-261]MBD2100657.1 helix-turn-helix transcriptional regulator [Leptolyngbya sp. FACHB-261]